MLPVYERKVRDIVRYEKIESEVRCGRYYLSVWTSQLDDEDFFAIPEDEEEQFHRKMQAELRNCIY